MVPRPFHLPLPASCFRLLASPLPLSCFPLLALHDLPGSLSPPLLRLLPSAPPDLAQTQPFHAISPISCHARTLTSPNAACDFLSTARISCSAVTSSSSKRGRGGAAPSFSFCSHVHARPDVYTSLALGCHGSRRRYPGLNAAA
eukprot:365231-Chlamydomonas_euryale.AAC.10